jgi:hypothetical protein
MTPFPPSRSCSYVRSSLDPLRDSRRTKHDTKQQRQEEGRASNRSKYCTVAPQSQQPKQFTPHDFCCSGRVSTHSESSHYHKHDANVFTIWKWTAIEEPKISCFSVVVVVPSDTGQRHGHNNVRFFLILLCDNVEHGFLCTCRDY